MGRAPLIPYEFNFRTRRDAWNCAGGGEIAALVACYIFCGEVGHGSVVFYFPIVSDWFGGYVGVVEGFPGVVLLSVHFDFVEVTVGGYEGEYCC